MAETKRSAAKSWLVALGYVIAAGVALATGRREGKRGGRSKEGSGGKGHHGRGPPVGGGHHRGHGETRGEDPGAMAARLAAMGDEEWYPAPMRKGDMTVAQLKRHDGSDLGIPILLAAKGRVYDVTRGRDFYGPGGAYANFAGIDCSRALAKMSLRREDLSGDVSDATEADLAVLDDWVRKFKDKYPSVGRLIDGDYNGPR